MLPITVDVITAFGWTNMAFELLVSFASNDPEEQAVLKRRVKDWLDAVGREDYVEGVIDGINTRLTEDEEVSGITSDERFESSPIALFDNHKATCEHLSVKLLAEFGEQIRCEITEISDESWQQCWRENFEPLRTKKFYIAPMGHPASTPEGLWRVELDARGEAFGTGQHATTRAIIEVLEEYFGAWGVSSVLDVGTGTGVYLILAHLLGAKYLAGTEISEDLVAIARDNCEAAGAAADVRVMDRPLFPVIFDLVIANILAPVLIDLMPELASQLKPGGKLILAGFVAKEEPAIVERSIAAGLQVERVTSELGWKCIVMTK